MSRSKLAIPVAVLALGFLFAATSKATPGVSPPVESVGVTATVSLAPSVIIARPPTLPELLDIVLKERPTAAALGGKVSSFDVDFPEGSEEAHVAGMLRPRAKNSSMANRVAAAIVKEGHRRGIGSSLLAGVVLTENPDLNPRAMSSAGARGMMQVMPFHAGKWGCETPDLFDVEANICHGVAILSDNLGRSRTLPQALLRYNGCVRGTNTPDCFRYPRLVYGRARTDADRERRFLSPR